MGQLQPFLNHVWDENIEDMRAWMYTWETRSTAAEITADSDVAAEAANFDSTYNGIETVLGEFVGHNRVQRERRRFGSVAEVQANSNGHSRYRITSG